MESLTAHLRQHGFRMTPQRLVILRTLNEAGTHLTPLEVYQRAVERMPGLTEPTVYRALTFLAGQGLVLAAHIGSGQLVYEIAGHDHHHLICRLCNASVEIDHSLLKDLYAQLGAKTGFQIDSVHVTFFGLCPLCLQTENHQTEKLSTR